MTFDTTINVGNLILVGSCVAAAMKILLGLRDELREATSALRGLRADVERIDQRGAQHHEWLLSSGIDRRHHPRN